MSRILFIGCGKLKSETACAAVDLYRGSMFQARLNYAKATGCEFLVLSAKYGLIRPDTVVSPYDVAMSDLSPLDQIAWSTGVVTQLCEFINNDSLSFGTLRKVHCEIHAGQEYAERLLDLLIAAGFAASWPVRRLSQGAQMKWYSERSKSRLSVPA